VGLRPDSDRRRRPEVPAWQLQGLIERRAV
jgi:hypothetical protein